MTRTSLSRFMARLILVFVCGTALACLFVLVPTQCSGPHSPIQPPPEPRVIETDQPARPVGVQPKDTTTPHVIERHTQPSPAIKQQVDTLPTRLLDVSIATHTPDSAALHVRTIDTLGLVTTRTYAYNPQVNTTAVIAPDGLTAVSQRQHRRARRKERWKKAGILVAALATGGLIGMLLSR